MMKNIFLVRHCSAEGQAQEAYLTPEGIVQAKKLADFLSNQSIDAIYSSHFLRAIQSATPLSERTRLDINVDNRLSERILSIYDSPNWLEMLERTFEDLDLLFEGGESSREAMERGMGAINDIINNKSRNIVVITHGNLLSLILKYFDSNFGFSDWRGLTTPDIYQLTIQDGKSPTIRRVWEE